MQRQQMQKREPCYIVATGDHSVLLAITDLLLADEAKFCYAKRLPQLASMLVEITRQIVVIDLAPWGTDLAMALSEHVESHPDCSCIFLVTEEQEQEIHAQSWGGGIYLVAKERLAEELPAALRQCSETRHLRDRAENILLLQKQSLCESLLKEANQMKQKDKSIFKQEFTRRSFIKGAAATAAAAGVVLSGGGKLLSPLVEAETGDGDNTEQIFKGVCRGNCAGRCAMNVHVRGGKLVKTSKLDLPVPEFERICQRGLALNQRVYQPNRLTHPLRRIGARGAEEWEQITWDEAIDEICTKWKQYQQTHGDASIAYIDGYGSSGPDVDYYQRLFNLMGSTHIQNAIDRAGMDTVTATTGYTLWYASNDPRSLQDAKYIFAWGTNLTEAGHVNYAYLQAARENGAKLISINPNYDIGASKADIYVPIRPGTDAVLAFAMMNVAVEEELVDTDMLMYGTVAPFLVKESDGLFLRLSDLKELNEDEEDAIVVRGGNGAVDIPDEIETPVINGSFTISGYKVTTAYDLLIERAAEYPVERASEICDIPVDTIYELAHMYAEGPTILFLGYGQDHWGNGHCFYYAATALSMITGQLGKKGTGVSGFPFSAYLGDVASPRSTYVTEDAKPGPNLWAPLIPDALEFGKYGDLDVNIKSLFIYKHNLLGNQTDRQAWLQAFDKIEYIIVPDIIMSETAKYADLVLPVPEFFELETYMMTSIGVMTHNAKAINPPGDAMGDFEIATLLGRGMGYNDKFTWSREEWLNAIFDNDNAQKVGIDFDVIKAAGAIPTIQPDTPFSINGANYKFSTSVGRAIFYRENAAPTTDYGQEFDPRRECLPYWIPPLEGWPETAGGFERNSLAEKYPLVFMSERGKFRCHTMFNQNPWHKELLPEPVVAINPKDAEARNIRQGDTIKLYNDRGYLVIKANIDAGTRPGVIVIDHGWVEDEFIEGHYQDLSSRTTSHAVINNAYFDCLVQAEKV